LRLSPHIVKSRLIESLMVKVIFGDFWGHIGKEFVCEGVHRLEL
jgi:hypothetical protein